MTRARQTHMTHAYTGLFALVLSASGCGFNDTAAAEWGLAEGQEVTAETTSFDVEVNRIGCNGGVTGEPQEPDIDYRDTEVVVTFQVTPGPPRAATCQGNLPEPYVVELSEPLGDRAVVDGESGAVRGGG